MSDPLLPVEPRPASQRRGPAPPINVLLVGGAGREHALAARLVESPRLAKLWITHPQNPGLASMGDPIGVPATLRESDRLAWACDQADISLVVIGPETPLVEGLGDRLASPKRAVFGPGRDAARLEGDKAWAKQLMRAAAIPTAESRTFDRFETAREYVLSREQVPVIKACGLAAGKGVFVCQTHDEAIEAIERLLIGRSLGDAGARVLVEERLVGPEVSVLAVVDGRSIYVLPPCQDHKRLGDGDTGPNTGGMGAICPAPIVDDAMMGRIETEILLPTIDALRREGIEYRGVLYAGLILTHAGPKVLEYNVRFGDPECQALMARFRGDLVDLLDKAARARLEDASLDWDPRSACCIVLASEGYPGTPRTGDPITGLDRAASIQGVRIDHAGTAAGPDGDSIITVGGRVLSVTALGETLDDARARAQTACDTIHFRAMQRRHDIGLGAETQSPGVSPTASRAPAH